MFVAPRHEFGRAPAPSEILAAAPQGATNTVHLHHTARLLTRIIDAQLTDRRGPAITLVDRQFQRTALSPRD